MADTSGLLSRMPAARRRSKEPRRAVRYLARLLVAVFALGVALSFGSTLTVASADTETASCGVNITATTSEPKQINLVLDDSGSMFFENRGEVLVDRWSKAKYALEVFAALMGPADTLNVYRLSDFDDPDDTKQPRVRISGSQSRQDRVREIHEMQLRGERTPFLAVEEAAAELSAASAAEKWLVVVTDGRFELTRGEVLDESDLDSRTRALVESAEEQDAELRVAYLAIGQDIPVLSEDRSRGIYSEQAADDQQLLLKMNELADRVFGRDAENLPDSGLWAKGDAAVDMQQMIVFAQGAGVSIGSTAITSTGPIQATDVIDVSWTENDDIRLNREPLKAIPDQSLQGQVAFFQDVPRGDVQFDISNDRPDVPVRVFYKPEVSLGYKLIDSEGDLVTASEPAAGVYSVEYGFMDRECNFVDSPLLGNTGIDSVTISDSAGPVAVDFPSGAPIDFPVGDVTFDIQGTYLDDVQISNPPSSTRAFTRPPLPSQMTAAVPEYKVSEMADYPPPGREIAITYQVVEDEIPRQPLPEEWATLDPDTFVIDPDSNLEFELVKEEMPGQLRLLVRAPEGDVYKAKTGPIRATLTGSYLPGQTESVAELDVPIEVENDISRWDRFLNWFKEIGWKILLALLLLALILGYIFKRRFSKRVKRRPSISGTPRSVGVTPIEDRGKFQTSGFRKFLPFVANTATLSYVPPGTIGFRAMKLKAGPRKSMIVTNWREIAEKDNVEINGNPLNSETRRPPKLSASGTISASTPQMTYEMTPST